MGQEPLREGWGWRCQGEVQAALSPAHIGPAPDPEDWWSYKDNLQGNFVPGAAREGIQQSRPSAPPSWDPGTLSSPRVPAPHFLPQESSPASEPQRLTMGHYTCAFQVVSGSEREGKRVWGWKNVCVFAGKEAGRSWLLLGTRGSVAPSPALSSPLLLLLSPVHSLSSCAAGETERTTTPMGSGADRQRRKRLAALQPAGSCSSFSYDFI